MGLLIFVLVAARACCIYTGVCVRAIGGFKVPHICGLGGFRVEMGIVGAGFCKVSRFVALAT